MSMADVTSARSSPEPETCPECDTSASVTSDLHKYQVACTCKPASVQYACADDPGPPPPAKTDTPPALPPRPPANALTATNRRNNATLPNSAGVDASACGRRRKYAWWCVGCGALAAALGGLLAAAHILLRAYTASPHHLETVPAAVPAAMLVLTGVCIMSLARRRNRYSYMIKVVGACCLVCALTCVLVTITTTVIHMNKLQTLKFCEYTKLTRTCTCFSMPPGSEHSSHEDEGVRCVFEGVTDCGVVHGVLYWCLRGVFALSVTAVLVCIFSSMLAYQLLSHERKKMYWEQLELRCRSLYRPPTGQGAQVSGRPVQSSCGCCAQCHPTQPAWDISLQHRFWAPGRIGNLYSPNPGTTRKNSAWSWFPWPRTNSQNSRCRMGVPQSGDSAYGFCDGDGPQNQNNQNPNPQYEERTYPANFSQNFQRAQTIGNFVQSQQPNSNFPQNSNFAQSSNFAQESFGETSSNYDPQTGVWGPPPPYSPQGRSGSRHHLHHQDPATATLLHHHHIDVHRNSMPLHDHTNLGSTLAIQNAHTCSRNSSYIPHLMHTNAHMANEITQLSHLTPEFTRINPDLVRLNPELARLNPELARLNPELVRINPECGRLNSELNRMNPDLVRLNPEIARLNPAIYQQEISELARLQGDLSHLSPDGRFNTLRGHLVPYPSCQRSLGMSMGNIHRDCRLPEENIAIECLHQKSVSRVSDQSSDSCQKQGKENLGFQNDNKHSPIRSSMQDCHRNLSQNAESEVYFADVSSCCNVSVKADCCLNPNVSALVGTIENHPESTSESDTGSLTLTRQQRPQPHSTGQKRRPRNNQALEKHMKNQENLLNNTLLNNSLRLEQSPVRMIESRLSENIRTAEHSRLNDSRLTDHLRINDLRHSDHSRLNDSRHSDFSRSNESRHSDLSRLNESRLSDHSRLNDSRISDHSRMNDSRVSEHSRMSDSRVNDHSRMNDSRINDHSRMIDSRISDHSRMNDSRINDNSRTSDGRITDHCRAIDSRLSELNSSMRMDFNVDDPRIKCNPIRQSHMSPLRSIPRNSSPLHPRQSSTDSNSSHKHNPEFFIPPPPALSPLTPNTEETVISDDDLEISCDKPEKAETSKRLAPDSQYEVARDEKELKTNHHHCYSDTNTMDSGWQSGSEKHVTD